jgi:DNA-binding transcriptional LysR family regulator
MNLTRLQTFVEVVRRGTFAGAADALSFTPSAVSQQMTKLEAETGTALLVREAGGVRLTEAGRLLHEHAIGIVEAVRHAQAQLEALEAEQVKRLRLGACPVAAGAVLPRALRLLRRRLPTAELLLEEAAGDEVRRAVVDGRLEVGVWVSSGDETARGPRPTGHSVSSDVPLGTPEDSRLVETVLRREPLCAAIPADHPLTRLDELDDEALAATPQVTRDSLHTVLALVAAGEGWALVPALAAEPLPPGVALRPLAAAPEWELRAARPASEVLSVGTLAVMDALRRVSVAHGGDHQRLSRAAYA